MTQIRAANIDLAAALAEAEERYRADNPKSLAQHRLACAAMPGGNTRASVHVDPFPLTMARGRGGARCGISTVTNTSISSASSPPGSMATRTRRSAARSRRRSTGGLNFGAHGEAEARFAAAVCARFPSIDLVRFTNSGTEANLMAVGAARAITGRPKILVFAGGYHGGVFYFRGHGSPLNAPFEYLIGRYNDLAAVEDLVRPHRDELAAILVEPMQGTTGCIPAERGFLAGLRALASETGALLIFDEVMTSRLAPGGLQEVHGILPDLTTLGKYLGGGMSFGAFGGRRDIMERFDPRRADAFQHAGTFNNNVLTMNAGLVGLTEIYTPERAHALNEWGDGLRRRLNALVRRHGLPMQFTGLGSMMSAHMTDRPIRSEEDAALGNRQLGDLFWFDLVARGLWFAKRGMFALSIALGDHDADQLAAAVEDFAQTRAPLFG